MSRAHVPPDKATEGGIAVAPHACPARRHASHQAKTARRTDELKRRGSNNDRENTIINTTGAEFLVAVAIVTSAAVVQIREHVQPDHGVATSTPRSVDAAPSSCEPSRNGIVPASCEPAREQRPAEHVPLPLRKRGTAQIWV
ncbi:MAG: hypothetical protein PPHEMADM_3497 [uncultured Paraburkholderia sp.]|nr:MAG: hypothetical protein PPHEMADE_3428 [uncultured Paraburkholderia sp.]CAH2932107.1 MAG: hypothetical protein PPHEMADM_3497 [uncultured Paraburkholderia sp.]